MSVHPYQKSPSPTHQMSAAESMTEVEATAHIAPSRARVRLVVLGSCIGFFLFGYDTGVVSGAFDWAADDLMLSNFEKGLCVSITCIAAAVACLVAGPMNFTYGRKNCTIGAAALFASGAFGIVLSFNVITLALSRLALGLAIGLATCTIPLYAAECVPPKERGQIIALNDLSVALGQVSAGLVNVVCRYYGKSWRVSMGFAAVPAIIQMVLFRYLPESPRWLAMKGRVDEANKIFVSLHGNDKDATEERIEMNDSAYSVGTEKSFCEMWSEPRFRRPLYLGIVMMVMNQASGINTVMYYSASILKSAGFSEEFSIWGAVLCDITQAIGVCVSIYYMERKGRRYLAIISALLVAPSVFALGLSFATEIRIMALPSLAAYLFTFGLGLSGVPWTVNAEIYPLCIRSKGQSQAIFTNWFLNGLIALCFPLVVESCPEFFFFAFCVVSLLGAWWMWTYMPETKGLTLEQIGHLFQMDLKDAVRSAQSGHGMMQGDDEPPEQQVDEVEMGDSRGAVTFVI